MNRRTIAALLIAASGLGACAGPLGAFRPLYGTAAGPGLSRIDTRAPDGRTGYLLREEIDDAFALDRSQPPLYQLMLRLKETRVPRGLRIDNVANRYELTLQVDYILVDLKTRLALDRGAVVSNVTYDSADQAYAGIAAHLDGQKRVAADAAQRLRVALGGYFAHPVPKTQQQLQAAAIQAQDDATLTERLAPQGLDSPGQRAGAIPDQAAPPTAPGQN